VYRSITTFAIVGLQPARIRVEVSIRRGTPMLVIVGLASGAARECGERIRAASSRSGLRLPGLRITVNLAPADLPKSGAAFDLPIVAAILAAAGHVPGSALDGLAALGELGLDGGIRSVRGVLPVSLACAPDPDIRTLVVPAANLTEASVAGDLDVRGVSSLSEFVAHLRGEAVLPAGRTRVPPRRAGRGADLSDVSGQHVAKRVLEIAAAGGHHMLLIGEPGCGKTMLARRLPGLLPPLGPDEAIEASVVHSVAGLLDPAEGLLSRRPFRAPHHTATTAGLVGGGAPLRPGEVSLAHHGVLFLDELGEFRAGVLEALRQPLESGEVRLVRASGALRMPARFQLIAAMNGCPCGFVTSADDRCVCDEWVIRRYLSRVSGPLLDRIDMTLEMSSAAWGVSEKICAETSPTVARRVDAARWFGRGRGQVGPNAALDLKGLREHGRLDDDAGALLTTASRQAGLSTRGSHRVVRVARTIADLAGSERVDADHVAEALGYRRRVGGGMRPRARSRPAPY
jgi:magnesium chelatase family protein